MAVMNKNFIGIGLLFCSAAIPFVALSQPVHAKSRAANNSERAEYIFKPGDTLIALATKYMRKTSDYRIVQRINRIPDAHEISIGKKIYVPFELLKYRPSAASLNAYRGNIAIAADGAKRKPQKGLNLKEGARLTTAAGGSLTLQLEDGSRISMPSNSSVRITRLRHILLTDSIDYEFAVDNGRIRSKITPFEKKMDRYRVRTPVAISAVRGTDYRTRVDAKTGTVYSETVEGEVAVSSGSKITADALSVPSGTGAAASVTGQLVSGKLLDPPKLLSPAKVQSEESLSFAVVPSSNATLHRVKVSSDAGFVDVIAEATSKTDTIEMASLPDGRYFAKATAVATDGFEGMPAIYSFKRQLSTLSGSADSGDFGYRFKWGGAGKGTRLYRFQLLRGSTSAVPMVDEASLKDQVITMSDLPDGEYFWRVGMTQVSADPNDISTIEKWTAFEKLTVTG